MSETEYAAGTSGEALRDLARLSGQPLRYVCQLAERDQLAVLFRGRSMALPARTYRDEPVPSPRLAQLALRAKRFGPEKVVS